VPRKRKSSTIQPEPFGTRLSRLRKKAGYSQTELAAELGISKRMVAYYERETEHPPTTLLPDLTRVLGVTADELLGIAPVQRDTKPTDTRLWRRLKQVERLSARERRQLVQLIDAFLERSRLKERASA
jgi:transcriptional regulator with XRE-family HTH domain